MAVKAVVAAVVVVTAAAAAAAVARHVDRIRAKDVNAFSASAPSPPPSFRARVVCVAARVRACCYDDCRRRVDGQGGAIITDIVSCPFGPSSQNSRKAELSLRGVSIAGINLKRSNPRLSPSPVHSILLYYFYFRFNFDSRGESGKKKKNERKNIITTTETCTPRGGRLTIVRVYCY